MFFEVSLRYVADMSYAELLSYTRNDAEHDDPAEFDVPTLSALSDGQEHAMTGVPGQLMCSTLGDLGAEIDGDVPHVTGVQVIKDA